MNWAFRCTGHHSGIVEDEGIWDRADDLPLVHVSHWKATDLAKWLRFSEDILWGRKKKTCQDCVCCNHPHHCHVCLWLHNHPGERCLFSLSCMSFFLCSWHLRTGSCVLEDWFWLGHWECGDKCNWLDLWLGWCSNQSNSNIGSWCEQNCHDLGWWSWI